MGGQIHVSADVPPEKYLPVHAEEEAGWASCRSGLGEEEKKYLPVQKFEAPIRGSSSL